MSISKHRVWSGAITAENAAELYSYLHSNESAFVTKYFSSATYVSGTSGCENFFISGNLALTVGRYENGNVGYRAVTSNGEVIAKYPEYTGGYNCTVYICDNAVIIATSGDAVTSDNEAKPNAFIITKNNRDVTTFIDAVPPLDATTRKFLSGINCIAYDDDVANVNRSTINVTQMQTSQCQLVPFTSCPGSDVSSYTPNVFYLQSRNGPVTTSGETWYAMQLNGYNYLTNGMIAIKDAIVS